MKPNPVLAPRGLPPATPKLPAIPAALNEQGKLTNELHEVIGTLECKCATIAEPAAATDEKIPPFPAAPEMIEPLIRHLNGEIRQAINRLQSLRDHIQL